MPLTQLMNAVPHSFAAIMAATVMVFPTPDDLLSTVTAEPAVATAVDTGDELTPRIYSHEQAVQRSLDDCATGLNKPIPVSMNECSFAMGAAEEQLPPTPVMAEKMRLTVALYCRTLWAEASSGGRAFDIAHCRENTPVLAPHDSFR